MQQKKRYVPKEDKEFVGMMLDIARRPGEKAVPQSRTDVNVTLVDHLVEKIKKGESIRIPEKDKKKTNQ